MGKGTRYFIKGEKCFLKQIEADEIDKVANLLSKWVNDEIVTYYMFTGQKPLNKKQIEGNLKNDLSSCRNVIFLIVDSRSEKPIGYAGLYEINEISRKAEFRILIGEKDFWNRGYGSEVCEMVTFYGFDRFNLNRIYLGFTASNKAAQSAYEKAGYKYEGTLKQDIYRNSQYYDSIRMAILRDDFYKTYYEDFAKRLRLKFPDEKL